MDQQIFVIAKLKEINMKGPQVPIRYKWISVTLGSVTAGSNCIELFLKAENIHLRSSGEKHSFMFIHAYLGFNFHFITVCIVAAFSRHLRVIHFINNS